MTPKVQYSLTEISSTDSMTVFTKMDLTFLFLVGATKFDKQLLNLIA